METVSRMPTIKISVESLDLLVKEAQRLGLSIKDVADLAIYHDLGEGETDESEENDEEGD